MKNVSKIKERIKVQKESKLDQITKMNQKWIKLQNESKVDEK